MAGKLLRNVFLSKKNYGHPANLSDARLLIWYKNEARRHCASLHPHIVKTPHALPGKLGGLFAESIDLARQTSDAVIHAGIDNRIRFRQILRILFVHQFGRSLFCKRKLRLLPFQQNAPLPIPISIDLHSKQARLQPAFCQQRMKCPFSFRPLRDACPNHP